MSLYAICFSPTGGTQKVMAELCKGWGQPVIPVDLCDAAGLAAAPACFGRQDICLIGVPSYGGRVPAVAVERLARLKADGTPAVVVVVYGNRAYEDTLLELRDAVAACGFSPLAAVAAVAEHSIVRQFGAGRPDAQDAAELQQFARAIMQKLQGSDPNGVAGVVEVPGNRPFKAFGGVPIKPKAGKNCTGCGTCAIRCPVGAIPPEHPEQTDKDKCISCMRCLSVCPAQARAPNPVMLMGVTQALKKVCTERKKNELFLTQA